LSCCGGKEKTFKSFWLLDLALHVAMGWTYRDRAVQQGAVIYCAFEGGHGFKSRVEAQRRHYQELSQIADGADVPLFVMPGQAKLIAEHAKLIAEFKLQLGDITPKLVVLDTLNRSIDGSESKDVDMTHYVRAAEVIRAAFGCVVIIVHHCGYDESHARGHTSLAAAVDAELSITRQPGTLLCEVTVKHMREGREETKVVSKARIVPLDPDRNGRPRSSIVLTPTDEAIDPTAGKGGRPDEAAQVLQFALRMALEPHGVMHTPDGKLPLKAVEKEALRNVFNRHYVDGEEDKERSADARRKAFGRALSKLVKASIIRGCNLGDRTLIWFVSAEKAIGE
jgi:hypothetical protein